MLWGREDWRGGRADDLDAGMYDFIWVMYLLCGFSKTGGSGKRWFIYLYWCDRGIYADLFDFFYYCNMRMLIGEIRKRIALKVAYALPLAGMAMCVVMERLWFMGWVGLWIMVVCCCCAIVCGFFGRSVEGQRWLWIAIGWTALLLPLGSGIMAAIALNGAADFFWKRLLIAIVFGMILLLRQRVKMVGSILTGLLALVWIVISVQIYTNPVFPTDPFFMKRLSRAADAEGKVSVAEAVDFEWDEMWITNRNYMSMEDIGETIGTALPAYHLGEMEAWIFFVKEGRLVMACRRNGMPFLKTDSEEELLRFSEETAFVLKGNPEEKQWMEE